MSRSNQPLDPELTIDPFAIASFTGPDNHTGLFLDADQVNSSVLLRTNDTNAIYVDKFQNIGINTISPAAQLDINAADGKCVQLTYNGSSNKACCGDWGRGYGEWDRCPYCKCWDSCSFA